MHHLPEPSGLITGLRIYVVILASIVAILGTFQAKRWMSYLLENKLAWVALAFLNFAAGEGCLESVIRHAPGGAKTWFVALAVTFALYAVAAPLVLRAAGRRRIRRIIRNAAQRPEKEPRDRTDPGDA